MKILQHTTLLLAAIAFFSCKQETKPAAVALKEPAVTAPAPDVVRRDSVINYARQFLGTKYCYASADPKKGFDCSGFVNYVFDHFGIDLPRSSSGFKNMGKVQKPKDFKVGDVLVFYGYKDTANIGHVGIICEANGMKSKFIHSSSGKEMAVTISELGSDMYTKRFYKCVDVIGR
jgi:cell wall-associated NlpC family hydrolase